MTLDEFVQRTSKTMAVAAGADKFMQTIHDFLKTSEPIRQMARTTEVLLQDQTRLDRLFTGRPADVREPFVPALESAVSIIDDDDLVETRLGPFLSAQAQPWYKDRRWLIPVVLSALSIVVAIAGFVWSLLVTVFLR